MFLPLKSISMNQDKVITFEIVFDIVVWKK